MNAGLPKALLVNLPGRLQALLAASPHGEAPAPYGLRTAGNLQEALSVLTGDDIFAMIIAAQTAETVGDHLLREIRAGYPHIDIMVLVPEGDTMLAGQIPGDLRIRVLEAPVDGTVLAGELAERARGTRRGFAGTLKNIQIDDLIQMCCLSMATISIRVAQNRHEGTIYIRDGEVVHAVCGDIIGEEAFYAILGWISGRFETVDDPYDGDPTIHKSHEYLLMEAARIADEDDEAEDAAASPEDGDAETHSPIRRLKVLLVEDSTLMAKILTSMLTATGDIEVVATAQNGREALETAHRLSPDIILLDVNLPVMNGSTTLKHIMIRTPCPVVVMSNVGSGSPESVIQFLELGAADFMAKPVKNKDLLLQQEKIVTRVLQAAAADMTHYRRYRPAGPCPGSRPGDRPPPSPADQLLVVLSGCSGHAALTQLLAELPADHNLAVIILQSLPTTFIPAMARHFALQSAWRVTPLVHGAPLRTGNCYLGTPGHPLRVLSTGREMVVDMPSGAVRSAASYVDLFLCSAVDGYPGSLMVAVLSGADTGNLDGLRYVTARGGRIVVQDPATCMLGGPSATLLEAGLADRVLAPDHFADHIGSWARSTIVA